MIRIASRTGLAIAVAAALLAGTAAAPAASAKSLPAATAAAQSSFYIYTYYSDGTYSTIVGWAELDCDGNFNQLSGYATQWFKTKTGQCPT